MRDEAVGLIKVWIQIPAVTTAATGRAQLVIIKDAIKGVVQRSIVGRERVIERRRGCGSGGDGVGGGDPWRISAEWIAMMMIWTRIADESG